MEIIEHTILGLRERIEGYENDIQQNDVQLQVYLKKQRELQSGLAQLKQELKEQERKKEESESPAGKERRRLEEAKRQYREEKIEGLALQSGPIQRLGLRSRTPLDSPGKEAKMTDTSSIQRLNAHGPHFARKFNTLISGFVSEDSARDKMKTDGGKKHKTRKHKTRKR